MKNEKILGIDVSVSSYENLIFNLNNDIIKKRKVTIIAVNPEKILKAKKDPKLKNLINGSTYKIPDGVGVVLVSKMKNGLIKERITGIDLMRRICESSEEKNHTIFLYGGSELSVLGTKENLEKMYPNIKIVGYENGYQSDNDLLIKKINKSKAQIIFVALGSPKQEKWILNNKEKLTASVFQGVGGSFDVFSGSIKRAPIWMQKCGLEWFYRLLKEPSRIFRQLKLVKFVFYALLNQKED